MGLHRLLVILTAILLGTILAALPAHTRFGSVAGNSLAGNSAALGANRGAGGVADDIAKIRQLWAQDLHSKQLDQIVLLYAPDAVFLSPAGERISGRLAIRHLCEDVMSTFTSDITLHSIVTERSGDLAYDSGDFRETLVAVSNGAKTEVQGNYLMVFKHQPGDGWLIAEQVWTEVPPAAK